MIKQNKDINPVNIKGYRHGYTEWYYEGELWFRSTYNNGWEIGYQEFHRKYSPPTTAFYIR